MDLAAEEAGLRRGVGRRQVVEGIEKLPGPVVQGKPIALQLLGTVRRAAHGAELTRFAHRSSWPLHAGARCTLAVQVGCTGGDARLWAENDAGAVVQTASLALAKPICGGPLKED